jgi:hypothetical protein
MGKWLNIRIRENARDDGETAEKPPQSLDGLCPRSSHPFLQVHGEDAVLACFLKDADQNSCMNCIVTVIRCAHEARQY